jgi:hypothetical protein
MVSFENQRSTKTLVILIKPEEWSLWLFQYKIRAVSYGVWEYYDLLVFIPPAFGPKPEQPVLPDGNYTSETIQVQRIKLSEWDWEYKEWHQKNESLERSALTWSQQSRNP